MNHEKLDTFQLAIELAVLTYEVTSKGAMKFNFALKDQVHRSVISVASNIAEGVRRKSFKDKARFLDYALSSLAEADCQVLIGYRINQINQHDYNCLK